LRLDAGESVEPHTHPEQQVVLSVRSGEMTLALDGQSRSLEGGDVVRFDGRKEVKPEAVRESQALIVLARRAD